MHRKLNVFIVAFGLIAAATQAQAQVRTQEDVALELIGGAIGGGLLGVAGVLTRFAIEDAMQRRSEEASVQASFPAPAAYSFPDEGRSGVHYNKPCSSFDPASGKLIPCGRTTATPVVYGSDGVVTATRTYPVATPAFAPYLRTAHGHRGSRIHVRAGRVAPARFAPAFHGGHR